MRVLVTDSDSRAALAIVRALGQAGHEVVVAGVSNPSLASVSKYCRSFEGCPDPGSEPAGFADRIASITHDRQIDLLLPVTEVTTMLVTQHRAAIWQGCRLPFADAQTIARASDKAFVVSLADQLGIPTPHTMVVESADQLRLTDYPFPVVVKPARSRVRTTSGWLSTGVRYAYDHDALRQIVAGLPEEAFPILLQERIEGPGRGLFACFDQGHPVALFAHRRLREKPPSGGVSVLCESSALDPVAVDYATRILSRLAWQGVAMVEFKQDSRDGSLRLMEINARFWGSLQLAIDSGVNFPVILAQVAAGQPPLTPVGYRTGVRTRWLAGDLDAMLMLLTRGRRTLALPPAHPGRWRTLAQFLNPWQPDTRCEIERIDDPGPMRLEWGRRLCGR